MQVVIGEPNIYRYREDLCSRLGERVDVVSYWDDTHEPAAAAFPEAEVFVGSRFSSEQARRLPKLALIHAAGSGTDAIEVEAAPSEVLVANTFRHERSMSEYVLMAMIWMSRQIAGIERDFRMGIWPDPERLWGTLTGRTVGLIGLGHLGREIGRMCGLFGMHVVAARRELAADAEPSVAEQVELDRLDEVAAAADFLVPCVPLKPETEGIVDGRIIRSMPPESILINVSRGPVVEERALFDALLERRIAGAVLDVWYAYPEGGSRLQLPSRYPFSRLDNVLMTPHISGFTEETFRTRAIEIGDNIERLRTGQELINVLS